jgi:glycosyltransferase involved in cell wall biosynthesis
MQVKLSNTLMISVVIPAYNEEKTIGQTLDSLVAQKTTQQFEVIIVDNNSTDKTASIVRRYKDTLRISLIKEQKKGRSPARRAGFAEASGTIIFSTDADTIVPVDWIEKMAAHFSEESTVAVTGICRINDCGWVINTLVNMYQHVSTLLYYSLFGHTWLSGFSFAIRKNIYEKAGGFDPELNCHEDTELSHRVKILGKIAVVRDPVVLFSGRRFQQGLIKGIWQYFSSWIMFFFLKKKQETYLSDVR